MFLQKITLICPLKIMIKQFLQSNIRILNSCLSYKLCWNCSKFLKKITFLPQYTTSIPIPYLLPQYTKKYTYILLHFSMQIVYLQDYLYLSMPNDISTKFSLPQYAKIAYLQNYLYLRIQNYLRIQVLKMGSLNPINTDNLFKHTFF